MFKHKGFLYAVSAAFFFGISSPLIKIAVDNIPMFFLESFIMITALCFFVVAYFWVARTGVKRKWHVRKFWKLYLVLGILSLFLPSIFGYFGYLYGYAANTAVLLRFEVFVVLIFSFFFFKERPSVRQFLGIMLGFFGVIILVRGFKLNFIWGDLFILGAATFFALFPAIARYLQGYLDSVQINIIRTAIPIPLFLVGMFLFEDVNIQAYLPYLPHLFLGGTLFVFVFGIWCYTEAVRHWEVWKAVFVAQFGAVLFGFAASAIFLGDRFSLAQWVGTGFILVSIGVVLFKSKP